MSEITIKILSNDNFEIWDDLVQRAPQATVFHKLEWLKIIEKYTSSKLLLFTGSLGNQIVAAIPFFFYKKKIFPVFSSPIGSAMIQNLGPIIPDYNIIKQDKREYYFREFQKELDIYINHHFNPDSIEIITSPNLLDARPYIWNKYIITPKYNYIKNIKNLDEVWNGFKKQLRKNIESAKKSGVTIHEGSFNDFELIIQQLSQRLDKQELNFPTSKEYLIDVYQNFYPDNLRIFIAQYHGESITGIIVLTFKNRLSIWVGATQTGLKGVYPVDLLQWEIIKWGNKNGYEFCEILGANIPTISYFKSRYNFDLDIYYHVHKTHLLLRILTQLMTYKIFINKLIKNYKLY